MTGGFGHVHETQAKAYATKMGSGSGSFIDSRLGGCTISTQRREDAEKG